MKRNSKYLVDTLLILVPFIYGYLVNTLILPLYPFIMQVAFLIFWIFVGIRFSKWAIPKWKSFLIANTFWLISFILFIWQFILLDSSSRDMNIAFLAQNYMLPFVYGAAKLLPFLQSGTMISFIAYIFMFIAFSIGFFVKRK
ncbi:hypothetical protein [Sporosarcina psychrophila]|uniref:Neutral ceramidase superfamily lipid hydrolase n=1 Tax=Sporosarcina psychrophila TaxID=1476 RepID=A0ABV2KC52_SPOPS